MNRLSQTRQAELRAFIYRHYTDIKDKRMLQSEVAEWATRELSFTVTHSNVAYVCAHSNGRYRWPNRGGYRSMTQQIVAAQPQVATQNGHNSIRHQLSALTKVVSTFDQRIKRLEEALG